MTLSEELPLHLDLYPALLFSAAATLIGTWLAMPKIIRKLRGAGIIGRDVNKPDRPETPEMGGIGVFLGFNAGVFLLLVVHPLAPADQVLVLVSLVTISGAAMTGVLDDLIELLQRFKAFIPIVFAAPLALYLPDYAITFPIVGAVDFGLLYPLVLVPIGIASAANSFNMLEGFNGLGAGLGIIVTAALGFIMYQEGATLGLVLLAPLAAALLAFFWYNKFPAKVFPGDTMTLMTGCVLACAAMLSQVEFWGLLLFVPHIAEFAVKAAKRFPTRGWAGKLDGDRLTCPPHGPVSLAQSVMKVTGGVRESRLVVIMLGAEVVWAAIVVGLYMVAA